MTGTVRIRATMYDQKDPTYIQHPDNPVRGCAPYGSVERVPKSQIPGFALLRSHYGWEVYHVPTDGTPGKSVPARLPGTSSSVLVDGSLTEFRHLREAKAFMTAVAAAQVLPVDRAATRDDVDAIAAWLKEAQPK